MTRKQMIARALGVLSLGLGTAQLIAPRRFARAIGLPPSARREAVVRLVGAREYAVVPGLMVRERPLAWTWARVGGDVMDIALLVRALRERGVRRDRVTAALAGVLGVAAVDLASGILMTRPREAGAGLQKAITTGTIEVRRSITVDRPRDEVFEFWRNFENFPSFMENVESVQVLGNGRSHWQVKSPGGGTVEWEAETIEERAPELISWRAVSPDVPNAGTVRFVPAPGGRGTEIHVHLEYSPPAGIIGAAVAHLRGQDGDQQAREDLRRLKQILETGEVLVSDATVGRTGLRQRPAQPSEASLPAAESAGFGLREQTATPDAIPISSDGESPIPVTVGDR